MTDELPNSNLPSPSKAEAQIEGVKEEIESRADVVKEARENAKREEAQAHKEKTEIEDEFRRKVAQLRHEKREKQKKLKQHRHRARKAQREAERMDAILRFAKGEIGFFKLFYKTLF